MKIFVTIFATFPAGFMMMFGLVGNASAKCSASVGSDITIPALTQIIDLPVNATYPRVLGSAHAPQSNVYQYVDCVKGMGLVLTANSPPTGRTYDSQYGKLQLYETNVPNIAFSVVARNPPQEWTPIIYGGVYLFASRKRTASALGVDMQAIYVATGPVTPGSYTITPKNFSGHFRLYDVYSDTEWEYNASYVRPNFSISSSNITVKSSSCTINAGDRAKTVPLPSLRIAGGGFGGVGATAGTPADFRIGLSCPAGVGLYATMSDVSTPSNTGSTLSLSSSSTAKGVGIQIACTSASYCGGRTGPVSFGPDSSQAGTRNQWYVGGNASSAATNYTIPFSAQYIQTASTITPGSVNAVSTITFSYQ
ncbi:type 1 fimbrial protein [Trinickia violacea]|uniref:Type 1 fimbrial protein n=1 Tax=Trinickia violacea TaxID=2571746 RepID=A0A4P8IUN6_9BURK|nr:fimbrial protein [Trinickia violacea]QCP50814.1 type 1 fimbrial protein [Trinickia violacea]